MAKKKYLSETELKSRIDDVFSRIIAYHQNHEHMNKALTERVYNEPGWQKLSGYSRSYLHGYIMARRDELYRHYLVWGIWWNDRFYVDGDDKSGINWLEVNNNRLCGFFWKGTSNIFSWAEPILEKKA